MIGTSAMALIRNENRYNDFDKLSSVEFYDGFIQYNNSANNYLFKISKRNRRKRFEMMFKANNRNTRTISLTSFWCFYC